MRQLKMAQKAQCVSSPSTAIHAELRCFEGLDPEVGLIASLPHGGCSPARWPQVGRGHGSACRPGGRGHRFT